MTSTPVYYEAGKKPTESVLRGLVAPLFDGVLEGMYQEGYGALRVFNFTIREVGLASTVELAIEITYDEDGWEVHGAQFAAELTVSSLAAAVAAAVFAAASAPGWLGVVVGTVGGALLWDALDDALSVSERIEAIFGQQDVNFQLFRDGVHVNGVLYDNLSTGNYDIAVQELVSHYGAIPGDVIKLILGSNEEAKYHVREGDMVQRLAEAMGVNESEFRDWAPDISKPGVTNGFQIISHPTKDAVIVLEGSLIRLKIVNFDGDLEDINVAVENLGVGGFPSVSSQNEPEIIIGISDDVEQLSSGSLNGAYILGGVGGDEIVGTSFDDRLFGDDVFGFGANGGSDTIYAGSGQDLVIGGLGSDVILGQAGDDRLVGNVGADKIDGGDGNDTIFGDSQIDSFSGEAAGLLIGGTGADYVHGGASGDVIVGGNIATGADLRFLDPASYLSGINFSESHSEWDDGSRDELRGRAGHDTYLSSSSYWLDGFDSAQYWYELDLSEAIRSVDFILDSDNSFTAHFQITKNGQLCDTYTFSWNDVANATILNGYYQLGTINIYEFGGYVQRSLVGRVVTSQVLGQALLIMTHNDYRDLGILGGIMGNNWDTDKTLNLDDAMLGSDGDDFLYAGVGNDRVMGYGGDDTLVAGHGEGYDYYDGGNGSDWVTFTSTSLGVVVDLQNGNASGVEIDTDTLVSIENVVGGSGDDVLIGNAAQNTLAAGDGNDSYVYSRGGGDDIVEESISGGSDDTLTLNGVSLATDVVLSAQNKDLLIEIAESYPGAGNGGSILVKDYLNMAGDYGVEAIIDGSSTVWTKQDVFQILFGNNEGGLTIWSGYEDDTLVGTAQSDSFHSGEGSDVLRGEAGDDSLVGYGGDDTIEGGLGEDWLVGGDGNDLYVYARGDGDDVIVEDATGGNADTLQINGVNGFTQTTIAAWDLDLVIEIDPSTPLGSDGGSIVIKDYFNMAGDYGVETIVDGENNVWTKEDVFQFLYGNSEGGLDIWRSAGNDTLVGTAHADVFHSGEGNDVLIGNAGDDTLVAYAGDDILEGGSGSDWLVGGDGSDTFVFRSGFGDDGIGDFEVGTDIIELHDQGSLDFAGLMADAEEWGGNAWLHFDGGDLVILHGVGLNELSASDFRFV